MEFLSLFSASFLILFFARKVAQKINLVDRPNERKLHQGLVPLVGGISIYLTLMLALWYKPGLLIHSDIYVLCSSVLVMMGAIDDKYDVDYRVRLVVQIFDLLRDDFRRRTLFKELGSYFIQL